jgi:hypothetical protein
MLKFVPVWGIALVMVAGWAWKIGARVELREFDLEFSPLILGFWGWIFSPEDGFWPLLVMDPLLKLLFRTMLS